MEREKEQKRGENERDRQIGGRMNRPAVRAFIKNRFLPMSEKPEPKPNDEPGVTPQCTKKVTALPHETGSEDLVHDLSACFGVGCPRRLMGVQQKWYSVAVV